MIYDINVIDDQWYNFKSHIYVYDDKKGPDTA